MDMGYSSILCVLIMMSALCLVTAMLEMGGSEGTIHAPCFACMHYFDRMRTVKKHTRRHLPGPCSKPCECTDKQLHCAEGVTVVKDGCGCCYMCSRQTGYLCNRRDLCDASKTLYCDYNITKAGPNGVCKARASKPCIVDGVKYPDQQQFQPDCTRMCTCQNGNYGCVNLCPQETKKPSVSACRNPRLMTVNGRCCREWTCDMPDTGGLRKELQRPAYARARSVTVRKVPVPKSETPNDRSACQPKTTSWSPCSVSCGVGMSVRLTNENVECSTIQQTRLCYLRPCGVEINTEGREKCTPTTKTRAKQRITFQDCISRRERSLKFCTTCKRSRCCWPRKSKTVTVEFQCSGGRQEFFSFMWIKKCQCRRQCPWNGPETLRFG